jgi:hypothetical protein
VVSLVGREHVVALFDDINLGLDGVGDLINLREVGLNLDPLLLQIVDLLVYFGDLFEVWR